MFTSPRMRRYILHLISLPEQVIFICCESRLSNQNLLQPSPIVGQHVRRFDASTRSLPGLSGLPSNGEFHSRAGPRFQTVPDGVLRRPQQPR